MDNENTNGITGLCLNPHDMAISKLDAGREKDIMFCATLFRHNMLDRELLLERLEQTGIGDAVRANTKKILRK